MKEKDIKEQAAENQQEMAEGQNPEVESKEPATESQQSVDEAEEVDPVTKMAEQIAQLEQQIAALKDERLRMMAEFENFRRNKAREVANLKNVIADDFFKDMLPVIDDIERAQQSVSQAADVDAVKEGIELIYKKFLTFLEKNGVEPIITENADFDTNLHEAIAVLQAPSEEQKNKILDCTTRGYKHGDTVIRHAKVVVGQ